MSDRVNLLTVIDHLTYDGRIHGAGRVFVDIASNIDRSRFNVSACVLRGEDSMKRELEESGVKVHYLGRGKYSPFTVLDLQKVIRSEKIHLVHLHQYGSSIFGRIAGMLSKTPVILHGHGLDYSYAWHQQIPDWFLAKVTDRVLVVSEAVKDVYVKNRKLAEAKVEVMPNGVPLQNFKPLSENQQGEIREQFDISPNAPVVGTVTRLREEKGNRYFIEAAAKVLKIFPNAHFLLVGDGPLLDELKKLSEQLGIEGNVIFAGFQKEVRNMISVFDLMVLPSLTEGHPLAVVEAMAMSKPVVATDVNAVKDVVIMGETGYLVPPYDPAAIAERIVYLLQNPDHRKKLGIRALEQSQKYSLDTYIQKLETIYLETAGAM